MGFIGRATLPMLRPLTGGMPGSSGMARAVLGVRLRSGSMSRRVFPFMSCYGQKLNPTMATLLRKDGRGKAGKTASHEHGHRVCDAKPGVLQGWANSRRAYSERIGKRCMKASVAFFNSCTRSLMGSSALKTLISALLLSRIVCLLC
jgi:hypothetical protein